MEIEYRIAKLTDLDITTDIAYELFTDSNRDELKEEFRNLLQYNETIIFLAYVNGECAGFAQCQLRHDYVEGSSTSPVGYLEGIYVREKFRHNGIAKTLLQNCENWAKASGCTEFASDCLVSNTASQLFHKRVGFEEANRIVCFIKSLK